MDIWKFVATVMEQCYKNADVRMMAFPPELLSARLSPLTPMNPYLARFLAVVAALLAYVVGHAVGYVRANRDKSLSAMVAMLETRANLERRNAQTALTSLDSALEAQGQSLEMARKRSVGDMVEYGLLGFSPLDQDKDGLEDLFARRLFQQNSPPPEIVYKIAGESVPFWSSFSPVPQTVGHESVGDQPGNTEDQSTLPRGVYRR